MLEDFHKLHKKKYGHSNSDYGIEVVNIRVRVIGKTRKPSLRKGVNIAPMKETNGNLKRQNAISGESG